MGKISTSARYFVPMTSHRLPRTGVQFPPSEQRNHQRGPGADVQQSSSAHEGFVDSHVKTVTHSVTPPILDSSGSAGTLGCCQIQGDHRTPCASPSKAVDKTTPKARGLAISSAN